MSSVAARNNLSTLLILQDLAISLDELAMLTGEDADRLAKCLLGLERVPRWLAMLARIWSENPGTLDKSREDAKYLPLGVGRRSLN